MTKRIFDPLARMGLIVDPAKKADLTDEGFVNPDQVFDRKNLTDWLNLDPVLANGQQVLVALNNDLVWNAAKIGDGVKKFSELQYAGLYPSQVYEDTVSYGFDIDKSISDPSACVTRTGNLSLHASKPIHNRMRGCLLNSDGQVVEYLSANWNDHDLTGAKGDVMVEFGDFYYKFYENTSKISVRFSEYPLPGYSYFATVYYSAYAPTVNRTAPIKLWSVVNDTEEYRGGNNTPGYDPETRSLLRKPATSISLTNFRNYARAKSIGIKWNCNIYFLDLMIYYLYICEYKTLDSQKAYNPALDANGYSQGGLGSGITNINSTKWTAFNANNPFVDNGCTNSIGNSTGQVQIYMPFQYDTIVGGVVTPSKYLGPWDVRAYVVNDHVSVGNKLYYCVSDNQGFDPESNPDIWFEVARSYVYANRYRGIENPFGHIWKWTDGIAFNVQSVAAGARSEVYVSNNPGVFNDANFVGYEFRGLMSRTEGYIKKILFGAKGDIIPSEIGAGSTTYFCDYFYTSIPAEGSSRRGLLLGGNSDLGPTAGFACSDTNLEPSNAYANVGSRLCFIPYGVL